MNIKTKYIITKQKLKEANKKILWLQYFKNKYEAMLLDMSKELNKTFTPAAAPI